MNYPIVMGDEATATAYGADQGIPTTDGDRQERQHRLASHLGFIGQGRVRGRRLRKRWRSSSRPPPSCAPGGRQQDCRPSTN